MENVAKQKGFLVELNICKSCNSKITPDLINYVFKDMMRNSVIKDLRAVLRSPNFQIKKKKSGKLGIAEIDVPFEK